MIKQRAASTLLESLAVDIAGPATAIGNTHPPSFMVRQR